MVKKCFLPIVRRKNNPIEYVVKKKSCLVKEFEKQNIVAF